ncbi:MAG: cyclase family protein [Abitibacteriaceae bacterium]|nr:cyclase family protein [Abditibacteriaceae bacterium]
MRLIDLSQPLYHECPNCPVHPLVQAEIAADHPTDSWRMEAISLVSHTGSHLDAPLHKLAGGMSIDEYPLEAFVGPAYILDLRGSEPDRPLDAAVLQESVNQLGVVTLQDSIVLLATGWGDRRAREDEWLYHSPFVTPDGAQWLAEQQIRGIGIDHYSVGGSREPLNAETHEVLLSRKIWIVEELRFPEEVFTLPQPHQFWALPINFRGFSGSFCRPVLVVG